MTWRPSLEGSFDAFVANEFFLLIEPGYDAAFPMGSLPRGDVVALSRDYIHQRKHDARIATASMRPRLPLALLDDRLGQADIDVIDFLVHQSPDRALNLVGPRGAGKTTLLHYVEHLLRKALPQTYPLLFIVDGNRYDASAQIEDFLTALALELHATHATLPTAFRARAEKAARALRGSPTPSGLQTALSGLVEGLPGPQRCRPVVVFDNLDHLTPRVVNIVLGLAKTLSAGTGVTSIACLRPGSYSRAFGAGDPQTLFGFQIRVQPPDINAWLGSLPERVTNALATELEATSLLPAYGVPLTLATIRRVLEEFVALLSSRKAHDDPAVFLEALCADDTRHLVKLVRRLLAHRDAPFEALVKSATPRPFHPLTAMFEGQRVGFASDEFVPNVLVHDVRDGPADFLLCHRLLLLLRQRTQTPTQLLVTWLSLLGVQRVDAVTCLDRLQRSLLIRSSNAEVIDKEKPLPAEVWLTAAGRLYVKAVFRLADYLLAAVIDVPLRHRAFERALASRGREDLLSARVDSLLEYVDEVRRAEERQLRILREPPPSGELERVLHVLSRGGLLSGALSDGLREIEMRCRNHPSDPVRAVAKKVAGRLVALDRWCAGAEIRLEELQNRAGRKSRPAAPPFPLRSATAEILVKPIDLGDSITMRLDIRTTETLGGAVVVLAGTTPSGSVLDAAVVYPKPRMWREKPLEDEAPTRTRQAILGPFEPGAFDGPAQIQSQLIEVTAPAPGRRIGVLSVNDGRGRLQLRLSLDDGEPATTLGPPVPAGATRDLASQFIGQIDVLLAEGKPANDLICVAAEALRRQLLTPEGRNRLRACMGLVDTLLISARDAELGVPWEWLLLDCERSSNRQRVVRSVSEPFSEAMKVLREKPPKDGVCDYATIGLGAGATWRRETPATLGQLGQATGADVVHLVGHCKEGQLSLGDLTISADTVRAFPPAAREWLILSACGCGGDAETTNLALAVADTARVPVFAPVTKLDLDSLVSFDAALKEEVARSVPLSPEEVFRNLSSSFGFASVFVRYGLKA